MVTGSFSTPILFSKTTTSDCVIKAWIRKDTFNHHLFILYYSFTHSWLIRVLMAITEWTDGWSGTLFWKVHVGGVVCVWAPLVSGVDGERAESCGRSERIGAAVRRRTSPAQSHGVLERWITSEEVNTLLIPLRGQHLRTGNKCFYFRPVLLIPLRVHLWRHGSSPGLGSIRGNFRRFWSRWGGTKRSTKQSRWFIQTEAADRVEILPGQSSVLDIWSGENNPKF